MSPSSHDRCPVARRSGPAAGLAAVLVLGLAVALPRTAHAYLDPASGSLFLQLLLGGVAGAALALKLYWRKVAALFSRKPPTDEPAD